MKRENSSLSVYVSKRNESKVKFFEKARLNLNPDEAKME